MENNTDKTIENDATNVEADAVEKIDESTPVEAAPAAPVPPTTEARVKKSSKLKIIIIAIISLIVIACGIFAFILFGGDTITEKEAREIALQHAKINESQITHEIIFLDRDDLAKVFEVTFFAGDTEYSYEINARTGKIVDFDMDRIRDND